MKCQPYGTKRVGYLATSAFLDENHDLIILIVNTVQQDLKNDNYLVAGLPRTFHHVIVVRRNTSS